MGRASKKNKPAAGLEPAAATVSPPRGGDAVQPFTARSATALLVLGALSALWAVVLWVELVMARDGSTPFCTLDAQVDCLRVWDSPFASAAHRMTGVPVAGWGVAWGLAAALFPFLVRRELVSGRSPAPAHVTATRLLGAVGIVAVFVLAAVTLQGGALCLGCLGTYALVGAYAAITLFTWSRAGMPEAPRAALLAGGSVLAAFLLVLYPGLRTPGNPEDAGRDLLKQAAAMPALPPETVAPAPAASTPGSSAAGSLSPSPAAGGSAGTGDRERDQRLVEFIASLPPAAKQGLANSLSIYRESEKLPTASPRALQGPSGAPVVITEFTDVLCSHCATLHETMRDLRQKLPGQFSADARHFPLDGRCNVNIRQAQGEPVRCVASLARICLEKSAAADAFAGSLFANQRTLTIERVYELGQPFLRRPLLEACVQGDEARAKLDEDVAFAATHRPEGTPLVLVNGRKGTSYPPFLFSIILAGGHDRHPAFEVLPAPEAHAHVH